MSVKNIILVGGFANSGKTALVLSLSEIDSFYYYEAEPRIITDPDGILSLESALVDNWNLFQSDIAIKRFHKLTKRLNNKYLHPYFWKDVKGLFSDDFQTITEDYINSLIDFSYKGMWTGINNPMYKIIWKINLMLNKRIIKYGKPIYAACPGEEFITTTQNYLEQLITTPNTEGKDHYILNEPFSSLNATKILNYFKAAKSIIVHRDPRDSYCNLINETSDFFPKNVEHYIKIYRDMQHVSQKNARGDKRVLRVNFEDILLKYDETRDTVLNFIGVDNELNTDKFKYFDPKISIKNYQIWKDYKKQDEINKIHTELKEYCYGE
jgi:hypothetical protein